MQLMIHISTDILFQISQFVNPYLYWYISLKISLPRVCSPVSTQYAYLACHHKFKIHTSVSRNGIWLRVKWLAHQLCIVVHYRMPHIKFSPKSGIFSTTLYSPPCLPHSRSFSVHHSHPPSHLKYMSNVYKKKLLLFPATRLMQKMQRYYELYTTWPPTIVLYGPRPRCKLYIDYKNYTVI
jgi:hypothetical protein